MRWKNKCARVRRLKRHQTVLITVIICLVGLFVYTYFYNYFKPDCDVSSFINDLCTKYHQKYAIGNMCPALCDKPNLQLRKCSGYVDDGKLVVVMECDGCIYPEHKSSVVFKYDREMANVNLPTDWFNVNDTRTHYNRIAGAQEDIRLQIRYHFDTNLDHSDPISFILNENYMDIIKQLNTSQASDVVLKTAVQLAVQAEFLSHRVLGSKPFLPKLYGTCGPAYIVGYTPSLISMGHVLYQNKPETKNSFSVRFFPPTWRERANAALSLLKMIGDIEDSYGSPLQLCDVYPRNFGFKQNGDVVLLDSDSVKFGHLFRDDKTCSTDDDCYFKTCTGKCDQAHQRCVEKMATNNLQSICSHVFVTRIGNLGLLRGAPSSVRENLNEVLKRCIKPKENNYRLPWQNKSDRKLMKELQDLLEKSV